MTDLDAVFTGVRRGAARSDRAVLLAHGAGSDMNAPVLVRVSDALRVAGVPSLRFNFAYRAAGRRAPDRAPVLQATLRAAARELARRTKLPLGRIVVGGRSMGGRMASHCVADASDPLPALGLVLLAYPLHPPGKPDTLRVDHLRQITVPVLSVSGTRDAFGTRAELTRALRRVRTPVTMRWLESADHGYKPLRSSGFTEADMYEQVAQAVTEWVFAR